ncbi:hypothetical protein [Pseudomonas sp. TUM22785]|uniref:hypothetical protein n=1 Tax=Pseudomonas sp. TUM22785 TaxID=3019098 RepID=UPI002304FCC6|nr:hypothetical protein [Pseudomonas sp. TUM22785]WCD81012.1 hypothetical protein PI990_03060 [Pseudomonas sp. TUM22785]
MSKLLGKTAAEALQRDIFGSDAHGRFSLCPPSNFDFFNSLKLIEIDNFANVTVSLFESTLWERAGNVVSCIRLDKESMIYSGSYEGALPEDVAIHSKTLWLSVSSHELEIQDEEFCRALESMSCTQDNENQETFFMLLRAHNIILLDFRRKLEAENSIKWQEREPEYKGTPVSDFYPFYESFSVHRVNTNSPLAGRSVFWFSYLISSCWKSNTPSHIPAKAIQHIEEIYNENLWHFPIDNARVAMTAAHFKHAFIDLYRCLEWLYSLPRCLRLKADLGLTMKGVELARLFRDKLAWRRAEQDSLKLLIIDAGPENLDISVINKCLLSALPPFPLAGHEIADGAPETPEKWAEVAATALSKRIYSIRNQYVHQLDSLDHQEIPREAEPALINILAQLCAILYKKYSAEF